MKLCKTYIVKAIVIILALNVIGACTYNPYRISNRLYKVQARAFTKTLREEPTNAGIDSVHLTPYWVGTTNFNLRKPNFVIIHHTAQNACELTLKAFTMISSQVSAHYVICKDGTVYHVLNDYLRGWHAGVAKWGSVSDINSSSLGVELDNNGIEPFTDLQINSLLHVLSSLKNKYNIPIENFIGHGDIAPTRKNDPNITFPWKTLAEKGFGIWYGDTTNTIVPDNFDNINALRIIGYDVRDSIAAIRAFKRHFQQDTTWIINDPDRKILFDLMLRYR